MLLMTTFFLILGALALSLAAVWAFVKPTGAAVAAYFGLWAMKKSGYCLISGNALLFWAVAVLIVVGIQGARGRLWNIPFRLRCYVAGGAMALAAAGIGFGSAGIIVGAAAGGALGAIACRAVTPAYRNAARYWSQVLALAAPVVVAVIIIALAVAGVIAMADLNRFVAL